MATFSRFPGTFKFRTQLNLAQMLRPAVQPGAKLDAEFGPERVTLVLESGALHQAQDARRARFNPKRRGRTRAFDLDRRNVTDTWVPIEVEVVTGAKVAPAGKLVHRRGSSSAAVPPAAVSASLGRCRLNRPRRPKRLPRTRIWPAATGSAGGQCSLARRRSAANATRCAARGGWIGPDLSNLVHRDYASVLRDITTPSFAINPDHLAYHVTLTDGRSLTGMVRNRNDKICVGDIKGVETEVARDEIETMKPALISIMPEGLAKDIGPDGMRDLLTFLLTPEPGGLTPAPIERPGAPAPRTKAEVGAVLCASTPAESGPVEPLKPFHVLLISGPKDHGPGEHDYPLWQKRWNQLLARAPQGHRFHRRRLAHGRAMGAGQRGRDVLGQSGLDARAGRKSWMPSFSAAEGWCCCTMPSTASVPPKNLPSAWVWPGIRTNHATVTASWT